jgi:hypothetical protein
MKKTQLAETLRSLNKNEFREFGKFVRSPFFNNRDEVIRFYNSIKKFYPDFDSDNFTKERIFKQVYKRKQYSDVMMRKLTSLMVNLIMEYLLVNFGKTNKLESDVKLLEILRERKMLDLFVKKEKKVFELFKTSKHDFDLYNLQYRATSSINGVISLKDEKKMLRIFRKEHDDFMAYFLSFVLMQYIRLSEWSRIYTYNFDKKLFNEVTQFLSNNKHEDYPLIPLYYNMLMLLETGEERFFNTLKSQRIKYFEKVTQINNYNIAIVLIHHCYKKIQEGFGEYRIHQFELTKSLIENDLIPPGYIEQYFFTNTVRYTSSMKEINWSLEFIEKFKDRLDPESKDEILNYTRSMIEFHRGNFDLSLKLLSSININRSNMKYDIKNIMLMNYYELGFSEQLISHIDAYKHFIAREDKKSLEFKEKIKLFLSCVLSLNQILADNNKTKAELLKRKIENAPYFNHKEWLLSKTEELLNKKKW